MIDLVFIHGPAASGMKLDLVDYLSKLRDSY
jgi:hypothetical protein